MTEKDAEQLRLLSKFHYVVAGFQALLGCFPILHFAFGAMMVFVPGSFRSADGEAPPAWFGGFMMGFAGAWMLMAWTIAAGLVVVGRSLVRRKRYMFCLATDAIAAAMCMPLGTVLGVLTIIVLVRPAVRSAFESARLEAASP